MVSAFQYSTDVRYYWKIDTTVTHAYIPAACSQITETLIRLDLSYVIRKRMSIALLPASQASSEIRIIGPHYVVVRLPCLPRHCCCC